jgi:hypothetical protein
VRHAPINASGSAAPAFVAGALDWRHRHQSPARVIDHLGDFHSRVVIPGAVSSQERLRGYPDPIRGAPAIFRRYASSGRRSSFTIEPTFVGGGVWPTAAINPAERRVVFRQRVECGSDQGLVRSEYFVVPPLYPLVGLPYDFSRTSDHIERAVQSTDAWLAQNGLEQRGIPDEMRPHSH